MNSCRVSGKYGIPFEIYKLAPNALATFYDILQSIWVEELMSEDFRDALIVALYKNKGNKARYCGYYRGISLVSVVCKTFACILFNRPIPISEQRRSVDFDQGAALST